jgi:hypothetical protein
MAEDEKRSRATLKAEPQAEFQAAPAEPTKPPEDPVVSEQVTYLPGVEDPAQTKFAGHVFHANLPKTVQMPQSWFERLRHNKFFKVGHFDPQTDRVPATPSIEPRTADEYKVHAVAWFKKVDSLHEFDELWTEEEALRERCEIGAEDLDYLGSLSRPRRAELKKKLRP